MVKCNIHSFPSPTLVDFVSQKREMVKNVIPPSFIVANEEISIAWD